MDLRARVARRLEHGEPGGPIARLASRAWAASVRLERPLRWRDGARVIAIGGATLGGSGKTPLAIACAETLDRSGLRVAVVGHGYGAEAGDPRIVSPTDDVRAVGDEALVCARRLVARGIPVVVAKSRQRALDLALGVADVAVVDGPCQTRPRRASLALLAVDGNSPWGAGRCPPEGDLRAPADALLAAADRVVAIGGTASWQTPAWGLPADRVEVLSRGAWLQGRLIAWEELRTRRVGLWTAIARPARLSRTLEEHGIWPVVTVHGADHRPWKAIRSAAEQGKPPGAEAVDLWLCSLKCHAHFEVCSALLGGVPVATIDHSLRLGSPLEAALLGESLAPVAQQSPTRGPVPARDGCEW